LQDIDQISLFRPICKLCISVTRVRDIVPLMKYAIQTAMSGTPGAALQLCYFKSILVGPVFIEFPIDTLYPYTTVYRELGVNPNARTVQQKFVNHYLQWHVSRMFANAWVEQDATPLHVDVPKATNEQCAYIIIMLYHLCLVQAACELIAKAQRPLMLIGSQALLPPLKADALAKAVEVG
jgi:acetolactate synthase-like protein